MRGFSFQPIEVSMHSGSRTLAFILSPALLCLVGSAQTTAPSSEQIVAKAAAQREIYINGFKDLLSEETKTFDTYDKGGAAKKRRSVVSTFIVYQSPHNSSIGEFRNVISVDGRRLNDASKRAQEFFEEIARLERAESEWERIEKEASRYDERITINGLTLFQAVVLADNLRPAFRFTYEGTTSVSGRSVFVVGYRQMHETKYISTDPKRLVADGQPELAYDLDLNKSEIARINGQFWIDAQTYQVWKEERRVVVSEGQAGSAWLAAETVLEYETSPFGILTPKRLVFTQFRRSDGAPRKDLSVAFDYANFTRPDVEVKSADVKN